MCEDCGTRLAVRDGVCFRCKVASVGADLHALKRANEGGYTQRELAKDIFTESKKQGQDISQRLGRRRPHERMKVEKTGWERA